MNSMGIHNYLFLSMLCVVYCFEKPLLYYILQTLRYLDIEEVVAKPPPSCVKNDKNSVGEKQRY